jgi:hypothetical protein
MTVAGNPGAAGFIGRSRCRGPDGQATTPANGGAVLVVGPDRPPIPPAPDMQKLLQVDRSIENSAQRVFYLMKPQGDTLQYIVDQQFETGRCQFQRRDTPTPKP